MLTGLELGRQRRGWRPYGALSVGIANVRVDDNYEIVTGRVFNVGRDGTTGVLQLSAGIEVPWTMHGSLFMELNYQLHTNAIYGRHGIPVVVGFRF